MTVARLRIALIAILAAFTLASVAQVKVVDATNGNAVMLAQVINTKGQLVGFTTKDGFLPAEVKATEGITIQHMAYEPYALTAADIADQTARLTPRT
jgi:hypothetical protein